MKRRTFVGQVEVLDGGTLLGHAELGALDARSGDGPETMPQWQGRALVGRPAWKGSLLSHDIDWRRLHERQAVITLSAGGRSFDAVVSYWSAQEPHRVMVEGGPDWPLDQTE